MTGTIHWLHAKLLLLHLKPAMIHKISEKSSSTRNVDDNGQEHILSVVRAMTTLLPQARVEHVGCDHFTETAMAVLAAHQSNQSVIDVRTCTCMHVKLSSSIKSLANDAHTGRQEKARAGRNRVEKEQLLRLADFAMIARGCLLLHSE